MMCSSSSSNDLRNIVKSCTVLTVSTQISNIKNNGEYLYMVKNIKFCSYSDYGCIQVKVLNYFNNYWNYNLAFHS